jgi:hypothetical protein
MWRRHKVSPSIMPLVVGKIILILLRLVAEKNLCKGNWSTSTGLDAEHWLWTYSFDKRKSLERWR